jgi:hypothetical protein
MALPIEVEGFEYSGQGTLPRPKLRISNIMGTITALILTLPEGLEGAKLTRIRTLARFIDSANFPLALITYSRKMVLRCCMKMIHLYTKKLATHLVRLIQLLNFHARYISLIANQQKTAM